MNETTEVEMTDCYGCGDEFPLDEAESIQVHPQTLETPAEYEPLCPKCASWEPDYEDMAERMAEEREWADRYDYEGGF
jgi:hypothetical protein